MNEFTPPEWIEGPTTWVSTMTEFEDVLVKFRCRNPRVCRQEFEENGVTGWFSDSEGGAPMDPVMVRMRPHIRVGKA